MALRKVTTQQKAQLRALARAGNTLALEAVNSIDNEILNNGTTAPITLYVNATTGKDTNPGYALMPFKNPQAALDSLPKDILHLVTILCAAGNYNGYICQGFRIGGAVAGAQAGLNFQGTYEIATPPTGTGSGTLTSSVTGVSATGTFTVLNDTTQSWTTDSLKGMLFHVISGTSIGNYFPIVSNTATSITVATTAAIGTTSTYTIENSLSVITTSIRAPTTIPASTAQAVTQGSLGGSHFINNTSSRGNVAIRVEGFKYAIVTASTTFGLNAQGPSSMTVTRCQFMTGVVAALVNVNGPGSFTLQGCYVNSTTSGTSVNIGNDLYFASITSCFIAGPGTNILLALGGAGQVFLSNSMLEGGAFGINITAPTAAFMSVAASRLSGSASQGIRCRSSGGAISGNSIQLTGVNISNVSGSTAFEIIGPHNAFVTGLFGSNNGIGIYLINGARAQIDATSTITGTVELTVDTTNTTLAAMRAAPSKAISSALFTIAHE